MPIMVGSMDTIADMLVYMGHNLLVTAEYWDPVFRKLVGKLPENPSDSKCTDLDFKSKFMQELCSLEKPITRFPENSSGYNLVKIYRRNIKSKLHQFKFPKFMFAFDTDDIPDYVISIEFCKPNEVPCKKARAIVPIYGQIDRIVLARIFLGFSASCNRCHVNLMFEEDNYVENGVPKHRCTDLKPMISMCRVV